jgi:hypothetical protein
VIPKTARVQLNSSDLCKLLVRSNQYTGSICKHLETRHKNRLSLRLMHIYVSLCMHICTIVHISSKYVRKNSWHHFTNYCHFIFFSLSNFSYDLISCNNGEKSIVSAVDIFIGHHDSFLFASVYVYV